MITNCANCLILCLLFITFTLSIKIPLDNLTDPLTNRTYRVQLDFGNKHTVLPFRTKSIHIFPHNLTFPLQTNYSSNVVKIGLESPSDFIKSVCKAYKVEESDIEFTYKSNNQLEMLISEVNLVEGREYFKRGDKIDYNIVYNYGNPIKIKEQTTKIIHGNKVFFNEYFILEILNSMSIDNRISYVRKGDVIQLSGNLDNFPHIIALSGENQIKLYIEFPERIYINTASSANLIGILAVKEYSKFQTVKGGLLLKRSSLSIVLYIFIAVYAIIITGLIINCWKEAGYAMSFVRNLFKATVLKDDRARIEILMTELE